MFWTQLPAWFNFTTLERVYRVMEWVQDHWRPVGLYEVLDYTATLELHDPHGHLATYTKQEQVRFCQDHVIAYQDQAWGEGDIFADYRCSVGVPVDRYAEGNLTRVLISLRETKNKGDVENLLIERQIKNGFRHKTENFQNRVNHRIHRFQVAIIFPAQRLPKKVSLICENTARTLELGEDQVQWLPDGRQKVSWDTVYPNLYEIYTFRWQW